MNQYVDKSVFDVLHDMVKDTNTKVDQIAVDVGIVKTALEGHTKNHERRWSHGATICALVIALAAVITTAVIALAK